MTRHLNLPADLSALDQLDPLIDGLLTSQPDTTRYQVLLALHELCVNIIEHGYAGSAGMINITAMVERNRLILRVHDNAASRYQAPAQPSEPDPFSLQERGYGMFIIHQVMDEVEHHRLPDGNEWLLIKTLEVAL